MDLDQYKQNIAAGLSQNNLTLLIAELAQALVKNEAQAQELVTLKAELAELKKPIADPVLAAHGTD